MGFGSPLHWIVIGGVALLLFGNRLPEVARSIGRAIQEFKKGLRDVKDDVDDDSQPTSRLRSPEDEERGVARSNDPEGSESDDQK